MRAGIIGVGHYVPEKIITNFDLEKIVDTSDEWMRKMTGIEQRRMAAEGEHTSDLGVKASQKALKNAGLKAEDIGLIITATITPDHPWPAAACSVQEKLGLKETPAFDISAACSGFVYGLAIAKAFIESGAYKNILIIGAEKFTPFVDWTDRNTCVLFGDGAGAAVVGPVEEGGILSTYLGADGSARDLLLLPAGGSANPATHETVDKRLHYTQMNGKVVFKQAVEKMPLALDKALEAAGMKPGEIDFAIFHQANIRIIESIAKRYNWPDEKNIINIQKYGNTSAATIPIALSEAMEQGRIKKGHTLAFSAFGGGFTWAGAIVKI